MLADKKLGVFVLAESELGEVLGFLFATYEWNNNKNGLYFKLQGIELKEGFPED